MQTPDGPVQTSHDWREWAAFLGYVLLTAMLVSVALASIVLVLSLPANDNSRVLGAPAAPAIVPAGAIARPVPGLLRTAARTRDDSGPAFTAVSAR